MRLQKILEYKLKGERNISSRIPLIINDSIIVAFNFDKRGLPGSKIICLNKNTFEFQWEYSYPFIVNNITKSINNNLFACYMDGILTELNPINGEVLNSFNSDTYRCGQSSLVVENKIVVCGIQGTELTNCLDLSSKQVMWSYNNGGHSSIPMISNGKVYQCTDYMVRCLELNSGKLIWENHEEISYISSPIILNKMIVVSGRGFINIYDSENGNLLHQLKTEAGVSIGAIISENNILYFGDKFGLFYAFKINQSDNKIGKTKIESKELWNFKSEGCIESKPLIKGDYVYFLNDDSRLICLNKNNGETKGNFNTKGKAGISGVTDDNEHIYLSVNKGYVYKLNKKTNDNNA